jgi:hypothetical protein
MSRPPTTVFSLALAAAALCCTGCTGMLWSQALQTRVGTPLAEGLIPAAAPGEPDQLFLHYADPSSHTRGYYAVAVLDAPLEGDDSGAGGELRPLTPEVFHRREADPRFVSVRDRSVGHQGGGRDGRAPGGRVALQLLPDRCPRAAGADPDATDAALGPWQGRVIWVPSSVPRPQSERVVDVCSAVALTPATVVVDAVTLPVLVPLLYYYSLGGTC